MAWVNVLAGSFLTGTGHHFSSGNFRLLTTENPQGGEDIPVSKLNELFPADPRSEKLFGIVRPPRNALEWISSPFRALARLVPKDPKTAITFCAKFEDGRRMIATTDLKTFRDIDAALGASQLTQKSNLVDLAEVGSASRKENQGGPITPLRKV